MCVRKEFYFENNKKKILEHFILMHTRTHTFTCDSSPGL